MKPTDHEPPPPRRRGSLAWITLALAASCAPSGSAVSDRAAAKDGDPPGASSEAAAPSGVAPSLSGGPSKAVAPTVEASAMVSARAAPPALAAVGATAAPQGRRRYVVAAMGDSLTDPKSHGGKYLDVLRERCKQSTFVSFGVGGNMTNMMRKRFLRDVYLENDAGERMAGEGPRAFTHVIILGGLGDLLSNETAGRNPKNIADEITKMVDMTHAHGAKAIVMTLPPWSAMRDYNEVRGRMTHEVNAWIQRSAKEGTIDAWFDTRPHLVCGDPEKLCEKFAFKDGIHWSAEGHRVIGEALHQALFADCE